MEYSQPPFYHFSEDSISLVHFVIAYLLERNISRVDQVLDVAAGCGVIGCEMTRSKIHVGGVDFIEIQHEFLKHIEKNISRAFQDISSQIFHSSIEEFRGDKVYDLILSNPPYFSRESSRQGPNDQKEICRGFYGKLGRTLSAFILANLAETGLGFVVAKKETDLSSQLQELGYFSDKVLIGHLEVFIFGDL